ncbi:alpha/beta hydrolase [Pelosinus sp. UFO1]|uniref:alpha/beta hydrolase n=1 Tax=Pelosinus sp. UFO1 TaxID=484770 RepID=UPI0004D1779E|nr:alpha/beta hydrolase [Pelosinus sp. UFO1]AIF50302.1 hypothetical protein UFO1_0747 [Pelosinus sp. UFO1]
MAKKITLILTGIIFSLFNLMNISMAQNMADTNQGVSVQKVTFPNNAITVVGNLYTPANFDKSKKYPAIVVVHPFGGVKEQTSGHYAQKLAEQGFITLAYDASYQGESGGTPRLMEIPDMRIEDVSSAVDYLTTLSKVDENRIGALGICTGGVYAIKAAQRDYRIKSVAGVSTFDLGRARREGLNNSMSYEERVKRLEEVGKQRTRQARGEEVRLAAAIPDSPAQFTDKTPVLYKEGYEYYRTPRGQHPNAPARYVFTSLARQMDFFPYDQIDTISPRPVLFVAGSEADTLYYSEDGYNKAKEPRELFIIPGATHMDLYDKPQYVPIVVAKLTEFYGKSL